MLTPTYLFVLMMIPAIFALGLSLFLGYIEQKQS